MNEFSLKEAKGTFLTPSKMTLIHFFIINHLVRPKEICMQNFRFLAGQEELRIEISSYCNSGSIVALDSCQGGRMLPRTPPHFLLELQRVPSHHGKQLEHF